MVGHLRDVLGRAHLEQPLAHRQVAIQAGECTTRALAAERTAASRITEGLRSASSTSSASNGPSVEAFVAAAAALVSHVAASEAPARAVALLSEAGALRAAANELRCGRGQRLPEQERRTSACLEVVGLLARSLHGAIEFASYGGHGQLLRLLKGADGSELADAAESLISSDASSLAAEQEDGTSASSSLLLSSTFPLSFTEAAAQAGVPFPTLGQSRVLDDEEVLSSNPLLEYGFDVGGGGVVVRQCLFGRGGGDEGGRGRQGTQQQQQQQPKERSSEANGSCGRDGVDGRDSWCVVVRAVTDAQQSQFTVGYLMWPAAIILGRWIRRDLCGKSHQQQGGMPSTRSSEGAATTNSRSLLRGRSVHELGAGIGLSGLVAAMGGAVSIFSYQSLTSNRII
jgi:hypothetical protein